MQQEEVHLEPSRINLRNSQSGAFSLSAVMTPLVSPHTSSIPSYAPSTQNNKSSTAHVYAPVLVSDAANSS